MHRITGLCPLPNFVYSDEIKNASIRVLLEADIKRVSPKLCAKYCELWNESTCQRDKRLLHRSSNHIVSSCFCVGFAYNWLLLPNIGLMRSSFLRHTWPCKLYLGTAEIDGTDITTREGQDHVHCTKGRNSLSKLIYYK